MMKKLVLLSNLMLGFLLVATPIAFAADDRPEASIVNAVEAIKENNLADLIRASVGDAEFDKLADQWNDNKQERLGAITEQDRAEFTGFMGLLSAPGSEEVILAMVEPKLAEFQAGMMQFVALFQGMGAMQIQQLKDVDAEGKKNLTDALNASAQWVTTNDLTNRDKAKQAIAMVVAKSRDLGIQTIDQFVQLDYDDLLDKGGEVLALFRDLLTHYGIQVDSLLDSIEIETLSNDGNEAVVETRFSFLGTPQKVKTTLVNQDGQWVSQDAVQQAQMVSILANMPANDTGANTASSSVSISQGEAGVTSISANASASAGNNAGAQSGDAQNLREKLSANPFLKRWGVGLDVVDVADGFATLKLVQAPAGMMSAVQQGQDITRMTAADFDNTDDRMAVNALINVLETMRRRGAVESVMIVPAM